MQGRGKQERNRAENESSVWIELRLEDLANYRHGSTRRWRLEEMDTALLPVHAVDGCSERMGICRGISVACTADKRVHPCPIPCTTDCWMHQGWNNRVGLRGLQQGCNRVVHLHDQTMTLIRVLTGSSKRKEESKTGVMASIRYYSCNFSRGD